jgi:hypothetical protein
MGILHGDGADRGAQRGEQNGEDFVVGGVEISDSHDERAVANSHPARTQCWRCAGGNAGGSKRCTICTMLELPAPAQVGPPKRAGNGVVVA